MLRRLGAIIICLMLSAGYAGAQIVIMGADPSAIKWKSLESEHFRVVYPEETDSLAREYAKSLVFSASCRANRL